MGTGAAAVIASEVQPLLLRPASLDTRWKLLRLHSHLIAVPVGELPKNPRQGKAASDIPLTPSIVWPLVFVRRLLVYKPANQETALLIRSHSFRHSSPVCGFLSRLNVL